MVLAALTAIGALDIHDEDVVGHLCAGALLALVLGHPDALCSLPAFRLGHDGEFGAEEIIQEGRLSGRLGSKDRDKMVVEAGLGDTGVLEIIVEVRTICRKQGACARSC